MAKIKKYYPGVNGLVYDNSKSIGVLAPQQENPNAFSTGKFLFPKQETLGKITDRKVMSQDYLSSKGLSFGAKAKDFFSNPDLGGIASSVGNTLGMMINANKKDPNPGRPYKKGSKMIKYQTGTDKIIGPGPLSNLPDMTPEQLKAFNDYDNQRDIREAIQRVNPMTAPVTPLTPKMASLRMPQQAPMSPRPSKVPVEKQSRRERKAENRRLEVMAKAPIIYNESSFVGPMNQEPKKTTPVLDNLIKKSMSSQAFKETMSPYKSFKDMTPAQQKQYRAGIASGKEFTVEGIGKYAAANKSEKKPLVKMKKGEDSWTPQQWKEFSDNRKKEMDLVNKEMNYRKNPDLFWKDVQALRKSTMGKNFDKGQNTNTVETPKQTKKVVEKTASKVKGNTKQFGIMDKLGLAYKMVNTPYTKFLPFYPPK